MEIEDDIQTENEIENGVKGLGKEGPESWMLVLFSMG